MFKKIQTHLMEGVIGQILVGPKKVFFTKLKRLWIKKILKLITKYFIDKTQKKILRNNF